MLKVTRVTRDSVTLTWNDPVSDGGSAITRFIIQKKTGNIDMWDDVGSVNGHTNTFTVTGLREGKQYYFAVYAVNRVGKGDAIETSLPTTPKRIVGK